MGNIMNSNNANDVPALAPPAGVRPNFVDPYSLSPAFVVTAVLCLLLATSAVLVRLATSLFGASKRMRVEEYTGVVSWLGLITTCVFTTLEIQKGLGRHQWDVPKANMSSMMKLLYINRIFYSPTILAAKLTILLQLMRIFVPSKRGLVYRLIQTLIWLNVSFYLANVLSVIFQCNPVPKAWNASLPGKCIVTNLNFIVTGTINVLSDVLILLLPLWTIWHLKLSIQKKLSVSAVFAAGIFANLAGIMRLYYSVQLLRSSDLTFVRLQHGMWTIAEITTAILCASLPLVPKFLTLFRHKPSTYISSSTSRPPGSSSSHGTPLVDRGLQPQHSSAEPFVWSGSNSGRGVVGASSAKVKEAIVSGAYVPSNKESGVRVVGLEGCEDEIR